MIRQMIGIRMSITVLSHVSSLPQLVVRGDLDPRTGGPPPAPQSPSGCGTRPGCCPPSACGRTPLPPPPPCGSPPGYYYLLRMVAVFQLEIFCSDHFLALV